MVRAMKTTSRARQQLSANALIGVVQQEAQQLWVFSDLVQAETTRSQVHISRPGRLLLQQPQAHGGGDRGGPVGHFEFLVEALRVESSPCSEPGTFRRPAGGSTDRERTPGAPHVHTNSTPEPTAEPGAGSGRRARRPGRPVVPSRL